MKLTLTYEFDSKEELLAHLDVSREAPTAPARGRAKTTKTDVLADVQLPAQPAPIADLFAKAPAAQQNPLPAPVQAPAQALQQQPAPAPVQAPAQAPFDRNMIIASINATINEKVSKGVPGPAIAKVCADIQAKIGVKPGTKIGELDDQTLYNFNNYFVTEIHQAQPLAAAPVNSFI